jgi:hypothetical protein
MLGAVFHLERRRDALERWVEPQDVDQPDHIGSDGLRGWRQTAQTAVAQYAVRMRAATVVGDDPEVVAQSPAQVAK